MIRKTSLFKRLLALALVLTLCPLWGLAQEQEWIEAPYALSLYRHDTEGNLIPLTEGSYAVAPVDPHLWIQLPPDVPLNDIVVLFIVPEGSTATFYYEDIAGIQHYEVTDFTISGSMPERFAILDATGQTVYTGVLTISYEPRPVESVEPVPTPTPTPVPTFPADNPGTHHAYVDEISLPVYIAPGGLQLTEFVSNDIVEILDHVLDSEGNWWAIIKLKEGTGYVPMTGLRYMSPPEEADHIAKVTATPTPTPVPTFPADNPGTHHAYVDEISLPVYNAPGGLYQTELVANDIVEILDHVLDSEGNWWAIIKLKEGTGYVPMTGLRYMSPPEEAEHIEKATATPTPTPEPTPTPTPEPTETAAPTPDPTPTDSPTPSPSPTPTDSPTPSPSPTLTANPEERNTGYAYVLKNSVNIRSAPDATLVVEQVKAGDVVLVMDNKVSPSGEHWQYVMLTNRKVGWVLAELVRIMTLDEEDAYIRQMNITPSPSPTASPTPTPSPSPSPTPTAPPPQIAGYARSLIPNAPVMNWPNLGASPIQWLGLGEVVYVQGQLYPTDNTKWHQVYSSGHVGYVLAGYLQLMTPEEVARHFAGQTVATPSPAPTKYEDAFSGYGILTATGVKFRSSPNGPTRFNLPKGTVVRLISSVYQDGYTWYQAESGGSLGYLREDVVRLLTVTEYLSVQMDPSYDSGGQIITPTLKPNTTDNTFTWATPSITNVPSFVTAAPTYSAGPPPTATPWATRDPDATPSPSPSTSPAASPSPTPTLPVVASDRGGSGGPSLLLAFVVLIVLMAGGVYGYFAYNRARKQQAVRDAAQRRAAEARKQAQENAATPRPAVRRPDTADPGAPQSVGNAAARPTLTSTPPKPPVAGQTAPGPAANGKNVSSATSAQGQSAPKQSAQGQFSQGQSAQSTRAPGSAPRPAAPSPYAPPAAQRPPKPASSVDANGAPDAPDLTTPPGKPEPPQTTPAQGAGLSQQRRPRSQRHGTQANPPAGDTSGTTPPVS